MSRAALAWDVLLVAFAGAFTQPSFALFRELAGAWVVCAGRHTVTRLLRVMHPAGRRAHDAYHRFLRAGAWSLATLWKAGVTVLVQSLCPEGVLALDVDDTLFHKAGRQIEGAGIFRDAVRSRPRSVVYALGLNLVVLTLRVRPPWGGEPLGLPINVRLYRKGGPSHVELGEEIEHFLDRLKGKSKNEFAIIADKEHLDREAWSSTRKVKGLPDNWDESEKHLWISRPVETTVSKACFTENNIEEFERGGYFIKDFSG
ncbi:MAG: transposase, partial [candidate division NC10 bacterium]